MGQRHKERFKNVEEEKISGRQGSPKKMSKKAAFTSLFLISIDIQ
jgi:hypothetical protein